MGHHGDLGREAFDVLRLLREEIHRDKKREVRVLVPRRLKAFIKLGLDIFPDCVAVRTDNHCALDRAVIDETGFDDHVGIPLREILFDIGYLFNKIIFTHKLTP